MIAALHSAFIDWYPTFVQRRNLGCIESYLTFPTEGEPLISVSVSLSLSLSSLCLCLSVSVCLSPHFRLKRHLRYTELCPIFVTEKEPRLHRIMSHLSRRKGNYGRVSVIEETAGRYRTTYRLVYLSLRRKPGYIELYTDSCIYHWGGIRAI